MAGHNVVVPLDGSEFSRQVLPYVRKFLDPGSFSLTLLRVASTPEGVTVPPPRPLALDGWLLGRDHADMEHPIFQSQVWDGLKAELRQELAPELELLRDAGFTVEIVVRFGDPAHEIIDVARGEDVSLVVMATHGRSGLGRWILGSVAEAVLRNVHVPVMMVRPQPTVAGETLPAEAHPVG